MERNRNETNSAPNYIDHNQRDHLLEEYIGLGNIFNIMSAHFYFISLVILGFIKFLLIFMWYLLTNLSLKFYY